MNSIESRLDNDEKMEDAFIEGIVATLTTRYTIVNSPDLVIQNFKNNQTFYNLVKICYGTLLTNATKVEAGQELPLDITINSDSNIANDLLRMSINNSTNTKAEPGNIIKGESGKIYYYKNKKLVSLYSNYHLRNNDKKRRVDFPLKDFQTLVIDSIIYWIYKLNTQKFSDGSIQGGYTGWVKTIGEILVILLNTLPPEILSEIQKLSDNSTLPPTGGTRKRKRKTNTRKKPTKGSRNKKQKKHKKH
jgi:hypothetical protein